MAKSAGRGDHAQLQGSVQRLRRSGVRERVVHEKGGKMMRSDPVQAGAGAGVHCRAFRRHFLQQERTGRELICVYVLNLQNTVR